MGGPEFGRKLIARIIERFANSLQLLALYGLPFSISDRGWLLEVFPLLEFPNNPFLFYHTLKASNGFFQGFAVANFYVSNLESPPSHI